MTTNTDDTTDNFVDPVGEFAALPSQVQQDLLNLYAYFELMLPEERKACVTTQTGIALTLEAFEAWPLTRRVMGAVVGLATSATLAELAADMERGL